MVADVDAVAVFIGGEFIFRYRSMQMSLYKSNGFHLNGFTRSLSIFDASPRAMQNGQTIYSMRARF